MTDATVVALSRKFIWVEINRDHTPALPKRFNVSAYPSLIVLGREQEKVYRFSSYMKAPQFLGELTEGLRRFDLYRAGKEWDKPNPRPASISSEGQVETLKAPSEKVPAGIVFLNDALWVAQIGRLFKLDLTTGAVKQSFEASPSLMDLCTDGQVLYGVESGWTAGQPIQVIDPATGQTIRTIVTEANKQYKSQGARGIAYHNGKLYVLAGMEGVINEVEPETGEITRRLKTPEKWLAGLAFDGQHFVAGSRTHLILLDPQTGAVVKKSAVNYPVRAVGFHQGVYYLMEQPIFGFDTQNKQIQVWPVPAETMIYKLRLTAEQ